MSKVKRDPDTLEMLSIDPGNGVSGWVTFFINESKPGGIRITAMGITDNRELRQRLPELIPMDRRGRLCIEMLQARGMPTSNEELLTCVEIGKFIYAWSRHWTFVGRQEAKIGITGSPRATDANVRRGLIERFGGDKEAIGGVKCKQCKGKGWSGRGRPTCDRCKGSRWEHPPGPLYGAREHIWAALCVACFYADSRKVRHDLKTQAGKKKRGRKTERAGR